MSRDAKFEAIRRLAAALVASGQTLTFADLAAWLNTAGYTTGYGTPYAVGGRGVARLVHAVYDWVCSELGLGEAAAAPVAEAFTNARGGYAYDR